jgi:hypothetical protein
VQLGHETVRIGDLGAVLLQAGGNAQQTLRVGGAGLAIEEDDDVPRQREFALSLSIGLVTCMPVDDQL